MSRGLSDSASHLHRVPFNFWVMKDSELRGLMLQQFYDRRRDGFIGYKTGNIPAIEFPPGVDEQDALRTCAQLGENGLIKWQNHVSHGIHNFGAGQITARGVSVIEDGARPPIEIRIDRSHNVQNVHIAGSSCLWVIDNTQADARGAALKAKGWVGRMLDKLPSGNPTRRASRICATSRRTAARTRTMWQRCIR